MTAENKATQTKYQNDACENASQYAREKVPVTSETKTWLSYNGK